MSKVVVRTAVAVALVAGTALAGGGVAESQGEQSAEFADVLAWLTTIANVAGVDLAAAVQDKYGAGCPGCGRLLCTCDDAEKP